MSSSNSFPDGSAQSVTIRNRKRAIAGTAVGNAFEWYDFSVYSYLTPVLSVVFFPASDPVVSILLAFAVFAVGFVVRPLGAIVFGHLADRWGRKGALVTALASMGTATLLLGLLPSYAAVGVTAPILLIALRVVQGLAAGGEFGISAISLVELAPARRRGLFGSIAYSTVFFGTLLGGGLTLVLSNALPPAAMNEWGWRIPFLLSIVLLGIALYLRRRMSETEDFLAVKRAGKTAGLPLLRAIRKYWRQMLLIIGIMTGLSVVNYTLLSFMPTYLSKFLHYSLSEATAAVLISTAIFGLLVLLFGRLSDSIGRKRVLIGAFVCGIVLTFPGFLLLNSGSFPLVILGIIIVGLLDAAVCGALPAAFAEMFSPAERASGFGVPYNIASAIFGGLAPFFMTLLLQQTKDNFAPAWVVIAASTISLVAALIMRESNNSPTRSQEENATTGEGLTASR